MTAKSLPFARAASRFLVALAILVLSASNLFAGTLVGSPRDVTGANYSSPVPKVQFKPLGTPQAIGTNIYWPIEVTSTVTNGFFSAPLIQGFYWVSPVIVNPFAPTPRVLIYMPDSATNNIYQFADCANIAAQLRTYISSNTVAFYFTNINNATGTNVTLSGTFSGSINASSVKATLVSTTNINFSTGISDQLYLSSFDDNSLHWITPNGSVVLGDTFVSVADGYVSALQIIGAFYGNGSGITNIPASGIVGLPSTNNAAFKNAINVFTLSNNFTGGLFVSGVPVLTNASVFTNGLATTNYVTSILGRSNSYTGTFSGDGSGLTNLNATNLIGTVQLSNIPTQVITNLQSAVTLYGLTVSNGLKIGSSAVLTNFSGTEMHLFVGGSNNFQFFQSGNMYANKGTISATGFGTMTGTNFGVDSNGNGQIGGVGLTNGVITGQLTKGIYNGGFDWSIPSGFQFSTNVNTPFGGTFGSTGYLMAQETSCRRIWPTAGTGNILLTNLTLTGIYFGSTALGTTNISFTIFTNGTASSFRGALSGAYTTPGTQFSTNFTSSVLIPPNTAISLVATNESGGTVQQNIRIGISWRGIEQ